MQMTFRAFRCNFIKINPQGVKGKTKDTKRKYKILKNSKNSLLYITLKALYLNLYKYVPKSPKR